MNVGLWFLVSAGIVSLVGWINSKTSHAKYERQLLEEYHKRQLKNLNK